MREKKVKSLRGRVRSVREKCGRALESEREESIKCVREEGESVKMNTKLLY